MPHLAEAVFDDSFLGLPQQFLSVFDETGMGVHPSIQVDDVRNIRFMKMFHDRYAACEFMMRPVRVLYDVLTYGNTYHLWEVNEIDINFWYLFFFNEEDITGFSNSQSSNGSSKIKTLHPRNIDFEMLKLAMKYENKLLNDLFTADEAHANHRANLRVLSELMVRYLSEIESDAENFSEEAS